MQNWIPAKSDVEFTPRKEACTDHDISQLFDALYRHPTDDVRGSYAKVSAQRFAEEAGIYSAFRERFYHKVRYRRCTWKDSGKSTPAISPDSQETVASKCLALEDHFPVGRCVPGLSIVDEPCIFYDDSGQEVACYDVSI